MSKTTLYGIANCDTVRKSRRWLDEQGIDYQFHDVRADGLDKAQVKGWLDELGLDLINKRSASWKALDASSRDSLTQKSAHDLILAHPTLIKRPLLDTGDCRHVGFSAQQYQDIFNV